MRTLSGSLLAAVLVWAPPALSDEKQRAAESAPAAAPRLVVRDLTAGPGISDGDARALSESVATSMAAAGVFEVITPSDIQTLLGLERQRQLLGCSDDGESCVAELTGALGARYVLSGSIARTGGMLQLTIQTLDAERALTVGRVTRIAKDVVALRTSMPWTVAEAAGLPPPSPPARVLPYSLLGAGAAAGLVSGGLAFLAVAQESALRRELDLGTRQTGLLGDYASYQREFSQISTLKTSAVLTLAVGLGLAAAGLWLMPPDIGEATASARPRVSLAWTPDGRGAGVSLAGSW